MALHNAALEQLDHKIEEAQIITVTAKAAAFKRRTGELGPVGLPNVLNKNNSIPRVLCAIMYSSHSKRPRLSKRKCKRIVTSATRRRAAVRCDQKGESRGTGQKWHGQQCCQEAPHYGCSEERPDNAVRQWWRNTHI